MDTLSVKCYDKDNLWQINEIKPFVPRGENICTDIQSLNDPVSLFSLDFYFI